MLAAAAIAGLARNAGLGVPAIFVTVAACCLAAALFDRVTVLPAAATGASRRRRGVPLGRSLLVLAATAAIAAFMENAVQSWAAIFVETAQQAGPAIAGLAPAAFVLGLALGRLAAHLVEVRWRPRTVLLVAALLAAPGFAGLAADPPVALTLAACLVAGIGVGPVEPAVFRSAARGADGADRGPPSRPLPPSPTLATCSVRLSSAVWPMSPAGPPCGA